MSQTEPSISAQDAPAWHGQVRMGLGWGWFHGHVGDPAPHAHYAIQVVLSRRPLRVWTADHGWREHRGIVLGPSLPHALGASREAVTLIYLEPDAVPGRRLRAILQDGVAVLSEAQHKAYRDALDIQAAAPDHALADVLAPVAPIAVVRLTDPRIDAVLAGLQASPERPVAVPELAAAAGMSLSHFQHSFRAQTGMPVRPYLRWRRLLRAMQGVMSGASLSDAAYAAGFADAAHFTRTMRRHFGITPGTLAAMVR
jgi:AraC-like DNA-binding protein